MSISPVARPIALIAGAALAIGASLVSASPAFAATTTYYVDAAGDDGDNGGVGDPFATIQHAVDIAVDGDVIEVGEGTFAGFSVAEDLQIYGLNAGAAGEDWAGGPETEITGTVSLTDAAVVDGFAFDGAVQIHAGAEGSTLTHNVFYTSDHQVWLNSLDGSAITTIAFNTFLQFQPTGQVDAILNSSSSGIDIEGNAFYGDYTSLDSVAVNLIGHSGAGVTIADITVENNTSHGLANFVVANGNVGGIDGLDVTGNAVYDSTQTTVYVGDNVEDLDVSDNLFADGGSNGVSFTFYTPTPVQGGSGPGLSVTGNTFVGNVRGINVVAGAVNADIVATGNVFYGNGTAVINNSAKTVNASNSWWSIPSGPLSTGTDAVTGSGATTTAPVQAIAQAFPGATSNTVGLTTTVHLGVAWANTDFVIGGLGAPDTFELVTTNGAGDATVVWPVGTVSGSQKIAVYKDAQAGPQSVSVTIPAPASYTSSPVPSISGHATVGRTLTAITRTWAPAGATLTLQWSADGVAIPGATGNTFVVAPAQLGKRITLTVTAVRSGEAAITRTSPQTAAVTAGRLTGPVPTITGSRTVNATLTATPGTWGPVATTLTYKWTRNGVVIPGATGSTYKQVTADLGFEIGVIVKGVATGYTTLSVPSAVIGKPTKPRLVTTATSVALPASASVGVALHITTTGTWQSGTTLSYEWRIGGVKVPGAIKSTYVTLAADIGKTVVVVVRGAKSGYSTAALVSPATSAVVIGTFTTQPQPVITAAKVGYPATVTLGTWAPKPTSYRYQWALDGVDVVGATAATFTPPGAALGTTLTVKVTAVRSGFTTASQVSLGKVVASGVFSTTSKPKITGTSKVGSVLKATTAKWVPAGAFSYQWKLDGVAIVGAVDDIYTVSSEDIGGRLTVTVAGARVGFVNATETSNPTAVVTP